MASSYMHSEIVPMGELVNTRGGWRMFPDGTEPDRQNMKKAAPHFDRLFLFLFWKNQSFL